MELKGSPLVEVDHEMQNQHCSDRASELTLGDEAPSDQQGVRQRVASKPCLNRAQPPQRCFN